MLDVDVDLVDVELADIDADFRVMTGLAPRGARCPGLWRYARDAFFPPLVFPRLPLSLRDEL
jgi:hypothetical protein